jgi:hypothetical protein
VLLWALGAKIQVPVMCPGPRGTHVEWRPPARWSVLLPDHHPGYITWEEFEHNRRLLEENAHLQQRAARKAARGGRALLTGMLRCGRCGRMLRVFYGSTASHTHQYLCVGDQMRGSTGQCLSFGGVRVDRAVCAQLLRAVEPHAVDAALEAAERAKDVDENVRKALVGELEEAAYEARLAARRYEAVDRMGSGVGGSLDRARACPRSTRPVRRCVGMFPLPTPIRSPHRAL